VSVVISNSITLNEINLANVSNVAANVSVYSDLQESQDIC